MTTQQTAPQEVDGRVVELKGRLFNTLKMRERLLTADAMLRPIAQFWILSAVAIGGPFAYDPERFPVYRGFILSAICFAVYYGLIGGVRRTTETYLEKLAATFGYDLTRGSIKDLQAKLDTVKPFKDSDDPRLVRFLFDVARCLHLPRRGLVQQTVVISQLIFLGYYVYNYVHYWGNLTDAHFPDNLWQLHGAVTLFGVIMMVKNASFLLNSKYFLAIAKGVLDWKSSAGKAITGLAEEALNPTATDDKKGK